MQTLLAASAQSDPPAWYIYAMAMALVTVYGQLLWWMKRTDTRAQTANAKLEKKVDSQNASILAAHAKAAEAKVEAATANAEAKLAKLASRVPCILPECPKRLEFNSFSLDAAIASEPEEIRQTPPASDGSRRSRRAGGDEIS